MAEKSAEEYRTLARLARRLADSQLGESQRALLRSAADFDELAWQASEAAGVQAPPGQPQDLPGHAAAAMEQPGAVQAAQSTEQPEQPGAEQQPTQPGEQPQQPGAEPVQCGEQSEQPGAEPAQPTVTDEPPKRSE
jgi:hypothetical protein